MTEQLIDDAPGTRIAPERASVEREQAARQYVEGLRAFYIHARVFAGTMVIIFVVNLLTSLSAGIAGQWSSWWSLWTLLGWGTGVAVHGLVVGLNRPPSPGPTWEQRQIDKLLES